MAINKSIWVSGNALPTIALDFQASSTSSSYSVISSDYIQASYVMVASGNSFRYDDMTSVTDYVVQSGDFLEYDLYWETSGAKIAIDLIASDGTTLRDSGAVDQNSVSAHPNTDLNSRALNLWYHRKISLTPLVGKTISRWDLVCENDTSATLVGRFKQMIITDGGFTTSTSSSISTSSTSASTSISTSTSLSTSSTSASTSMSTSTSISISTSSTSQSTSTTTLITSDVPVGYIRKQIFRSGSGPDTVNIAMRRRR